MEFLELIAVPAIVAAIVGFLALLKQAVNANKKVLRFFPLIGVVLGAGLGILAFYIAPAIIPAATAVTALKVGIAGGLAATGTHQVFKQLVPSKPNDEDDADKRENDTDTKE